MVNEDDEDMSTPEIMEYLNSQFRESELLTQDFRKFMAQSLADLASKGRAHWPVGFRLFYVKDMELFDGQICDAIRVDFVAMPALDHTGEPTPAEIDYAAEYMQVYQCALQLSAGEEQHVVGFIWTLKNSDIDKSAEETRKLIDRSTTRAKISMSRIGQSLSEDHKQKLSKSIKGKAVTEAVRVKLNQNNVARCAMTVSIEGTVFASISEAARQLGVSNTYIRRRVLHMEKWKDCFFVSEKRPLEEVFITDNSNIKSFLLTDPHGKIHKGVNVREFCLAHNLCPYSIRSLCRGTVKTYKGWTGRYLD